MAKFIRVPCELTAWTGDPGRCNWCNKAIPAGGRRTVWCRDLCRTQWERNHIWRRARIFARRRAKYRCSRPGCTAAHRDIEINHIDPRNGEGYGPGCGHHQSNLEGLCRAHHREVTSAQASARAAARRAAKKADENA
jgi:hypothetical protein